MPRKANLGRLSDVDIRLLRVFRSVVACGGVSAAERELNIGRSTISRHLTDLELRLGVRLCDRGPAGFALTTEGERVLGAIPTRDCMVLERFFDESGGMQLVLHSLFGGRINRALGLALRKRFCRSFGFELQAAANEESIVLSLGHQHSFDLAEVFDYVAPHEARRILEQATLPTPMFTTRWRWNASRSP